MSITHHPSESILFAYAGGSLSEGLSLVVATHLALCPSCRAHVLTLDAVGGVLLDDLPPTPMAGDALQRVLTKLEATAAAVDPMGSPPSSDRWGVALPQPLAAYADRAADQRWRLLVPGIRQIELLSRPNSGGGTRLIRVAPGSAVARHSHGGIELTLVLHGSYRDELGRFAAGDLAETDPQTTHRPVADAATGCVCLTASEAPTRFKTLIGRLLQTWLRV